MLNKSTNIFYVKTALTFLFICISLQHINVLDISERVGTDVLVSRENAEN